MRLRDQEKLQVPDDPAKAHFPPFWKTSAATPLDVVWRVPSNSPNPTDKTTIALMRRTAVHHPDTIIASALDLQKGKPAAGASFTAGRDANLRRHWKIPRCQAPDELQTVGTAADPFGPADSAPMAGGQIDRSRANCSVCSVVDMIMGQAPPAHLAMPEVFGVSGQTNMQRVTHGGLTAARTSRAKHKTLHISTLHQQSAAFCQPSTARV